MNYQYVKVNPSCRDSRHSFSGVLCTQNKNVCHFSIIDFSFFGPNILVSVSGVGSSLIVEI